MLGLLIVLWFLGNAIDDFAVLLAWIGSLSGRRDAPRLPEPGELSLMPERRIAIFIPAWREERVIARMLERNLAALRYQAYTIFVGAYPNDRATQNAVAQVAARNSKVRLVVGPRPGPTSKADCMNAIYRRLCEIERDEGRFDLVLIHDAEDVLHPDELHWKNWFAEEYDMVQTAVLPMATPAFELTHGVYCDDFAEYHTKDLRARSWLGGFIPSCGVATAFGRDQLDRLVAGGTPAGQPFSPGCLTEDYDLGYRLYRQHARQLFVPLPAGRGTLLATREYFPRSLSAAVRQRSRWITGIALQGWCNHGWGRNPIEAYWFWRDRKGLVGNPLSLAASAALLLHLAGWPLPVAGAPPRLMFAAAILSGLNLLARAWCSARAYGWWFGLFVPVRLLWCNFINTLAVAFAISTFAHARWVGRGLAWRKTEHSYPWAGATHTKPLGEILVQQGYLTRQALRRALATRPRGVSLAEHLWRSGRLTPAEIQRARNEQHGLAGETAWGCTASQLLPVELAERWRIVPIGIDKGEIRLASVEMPAAGLERDLARQTRLRPRLVLVTPSRFGALRAQFQGR